MSSISSSPSGKGPPTPSLVFFRFPALEGVDVSGTALAPERGDPGEETGGNHAFSMALAEIAGELIELVDKV